MTTTTENQHSPEVQDIIAPVRQEGADFRDGNDSLKQINSSYNWERGEIVRRVSAKFPDRVQHVVECSACRRGSPHSGCSDVYVVEGIRYTVNSGMLA
jgi:hypothetical protein